MSILPIAVPHMKEFLKEAATKKRLFWIREHYLAKFYETSQMAPSKIMATSGQNGTINHIIRLLHAIELRQVIIVKKAFN